MIQKADSGLKHSHWIDSVYKSSYNPFHVALLGMSVRSLMSHTLLIISDTDLPPFHDAIFYHLHIFRKWITCIPHNDHLL